VSTDTPTSAAQPNTGGRACKYDHFAAEFVDDPFPIWKDLRDNEPIAYSENYGGYYLITRYEDIDEAARTPELFSSTGGAGVPPLPMIGMIPIDVDGEAQKEYRHLLDPALRIGPVMEREPQIRQIAIDLIEPLTHKTEFDAAQELAMHLPPQATLSFLGFPEESHKKMEQAAFDITRLRGQESPRIMEAGVEVVQTAIELINARKESDHEYDDIVGLLMKSEFEGRPLKDEEIVQFLAVLLLGAVDTTTSAIAGSIYWLAMHPEAQKELREGGEIPSNVLEELLRWVTPLQGLGRTVTKDTEFGGCPLHKDDRVLLMWGSGNRDESVFENPDEVDFDRKPNRHLSFGMGPHRCAGVHLGKLMLRVTLEEFLKRVGDFELGDPDQLQWLGGEARGLRCVPIRRVGA
jgi:cytochrome P450